MSGIFISGLGAVSPAGWGVEKLLQVAKGGALPEAQALERPGWTEPLKGNRVPKPESRAAWSAHPRMRRTALISQFAMGAAVEALGEATGGPLGIVFCTTCGCVNYSRRFYDEVLRDPQAASPLLFPETVFNAPASHLSAVLGTACANYALVGDTGVFFHGLALAAGWLEEGRVERCLVVAAEEADWIVADVMRHFSKRTVVAEGAGAVLLTREPSPGTSVELEFITEPQAYRKGGGRNARAQAADRVRSALGVTQPATTEIAKMGEGFAATSAWLAIESLVAAQRAKQPRATVVVSGAYQEAMGASFLLTDGAATHGGWDRWNLLSHGKPKST